MHARCLNTAVGDEGGFAPNLGGNVKAMEVILQAIEKAGYTPGEDVIALDIDATEFYEFRKHGHYKLPIEGKELSSDAAGRPVDRLEHPFPIISLEDGMAEDDWDRLEVALPKDSASKVQLVGDDLLVTNTAHLSEASRKGMQFAPCQGEPNRHPDRKLAAIEMATRQAGYTAVIAIAPARPRTRPSPTWSVAYNTGQIKTGSLSRSRPRCQV